MTTYTITYTGQWIGLNQLYNKNRYHAATIKKQWKLVLHQLVQQAQIQPLAAFTLHVRYNSRMDCENVVDELRAMQLVVNDDKRYHKGLSIEPDTNLKHNTYCITLLQLPVE